MYSGGIIESKKGKIYVDKKVIVQYAGSVAMASFGIVGMAAINVKDGIVGLLKGDHFSRGIHVKVRDDGLVDIDYHVIVSYGVSIATVTENLIHSVKYKLDAFTGLEVRQVRVFVEGIRVID